MDDRTVLVRGIPAKLLEQIDLRAIASKKVKGIGWSRNNEIVAMLEDAAKTKAKR